MAAEKISAFAAAPVAEKRQSVLISLAVSACLLIGLVMASGLTVDGVLQAISRVPAWAYVAIALVQACIIFLAALKWHLILSSGHNGLPFREAVRATTIGALAGQVAPIQIVTPAVRAWIARKHGVAAGRAVGTSLLEQVFEVIVLAAMAGAAVITQVAGLSFLSGLFLALPVTISLTLLIRPFLFFAQKTFGALAGSMAGWVSTQLTRLSDGFAAAQKLSDRLLFGLTGLSFMRYALLAGLNILVLSHFVPDVDKVVLLAAFPLVLFLMSLPFFPGGLGVTELTWVGVLMAAGETLATASEAALALRVVTTFGFVLIAPVLILLPSQRQKVSQ